MPKPERIAVFDQMTALDLFAGTGWGVACKRLGIEELGVENAIEVIETRDAAGMRTIFFDVWTGLEEPAIVPRRVPLYIASPPCQTFSPSGNGAGRRALGEVIEAIESELYRTPARLREFGEKHDPRTALVLAPLAYIVRDLPMYVVLEQVGPVLPVWQKYAEVMEGLGYSVWTGILNAEQYGVPQTRKRAVLIARRDGKEARMPKPTHSRYYPHTPERLDEGVLPWVSMAEALGWGRTARPSVTVTGGGTATGGAEPLGHWAREVAAPDFVMRSNYGTSGDPANRGERRGDQPAPTMTSKAGRNHWVAEQTTRVTVEEAALLQTYPAGFPFVGNKGQRHLHVGNAVPPLLAEAILKEVLS